MHGVLKMAINDLVKKIELTGDAEDRLKRALRDMIDSAQNFRKTSEWDDLHAMYWRMHLSIPDQKVKSFPWENASNMYLPLTQVMDHAVVAHEFDTLLAVSPNVIGMESGDYLESQDLSQYYFDYYYKEVIPLQQLGADWLMDNTVDGTSSVKVRQNQDFFVRREDRIQEREERIDRSVEKGFPEGSIVEVNVNYDRVEDVKIDQVNQTTVELSDMEDIFVAPGSGPGFQYPVCPWYYQRQYLNHEELIARQRLGYKVTEKMNDHFLKREPTEKDKAINEKEGLEENEVMETLFTIEMYMRWPLPARFQVVSNEMPEGEDDVIEQKASEEEGYAEEVIVNYCIPTEEIMMIRPLSRVCPDNKRPHVLNHYQRINGRYFYGSGIPSKLRYIQQGLNTARNQGVDYGTLANVPFYMYSPAITGVMPSIIGISPGQGIEVQDPRGVLFPRFNHDPNFFLSQEQQLQAYGEKLSSISDLNIGRNPSTPNAPRTARGMYYQIQQSTVAFTILVSLHAMAFVEMFRKVHAYHKRFAKPDAMYRILNRKSGAFQKKSVQRGMFNDDVDFDFTFNNSRSTEAQTNTTLYQITLDAIGKAMQMPPLANNIRMMLSDIWLSSGKKNFDLIWPKNLIPAMPQANSPMPGGNQPGRIPGGGGGMDMNKLGGMGGEMPKPEVAV